MSDSNPTKTESVVDAARRLRSAVMPAMRELDAALAGAEESDCLPLGLKLYVWEEVLCDYTCGMAFAVAESVEEAMRLIDKQQGYAVSDQLGIPTHIITEPAGFSVYGGG